jgi:type IV secretion system protein VirB9
MKKLIVIPICLFLSLSLAFANQTPRALATDKRIKIVAYHQDDVVTIHSSHFVSTAIFFGKNEVITYIDMGDQIAWEVSIAKESPNMLFVKPKLPESDTNMTVITHKHVYQFRLFTHEGDTPKSKNVIYALQFKYPDDEKNQFENSLSQLQHSFLGHAEGDAVRWNYEYSFYGSKRIAPIQAVDNGTFTIFKFPKRASMPAIFAVDAHRNESLVNFRVSGDYVFIQGVRHQYTLRNGSDVTTVYNDCFNLN